jgi:hypothetical protein
MSWIIAPFSETGVPGAFGVSGALGASGVFGASGTAGVFGTSGIAGLAGISGVTGAAGTAAVVAHPKANSTTAARTMSLFIPRLLFEMVKNPCNLTAF